MRHLAAGLGQVRDRMGATDDSCFKLYTDLVEAEFTEDEARDLVRRLNADHHIVGDDPAGRLQPLVESTIRIGGPLQTVPGKRPNSCAGGANRSRKDNDDREACRQFAIAREAERWPNYG